VSNNHQVIKVILTGATGLAGSEVLRQGLADSRVQSITVVSRKPVAQSHPKIVQVVHENYLDYSAIQSQLADHDACLWCLGVSQNEVSAEEYRKITLDYAIAGAKAMLAINPGLTFIFLSGQGADSAEKSRLLFGRVKGATENQLNLLGLKHLYHFRPGYIHPVTPGTSRHLWDRFLAPVAPFLHKVVPNMLVDADELAKAMLHVAENGYPKRILENRDIRQIAAGLKTS
jgi:uncharacterized protein YbjT (DUF2867 family)